MVVNLGPRRIGKRSWISRDLALVHQVFGIGSSRDQAGWAAGDPVQLDPRPRDRLSQGILDIRRLGLGPDGAMAREVQVNGTARVAGISTIGLKGSGDSNEHLAQPVTVKGQVGLKRGQEPLSEGLGKLKPAGLDGNGESLGHEVPFRDARTPPYSTVWVDFPGIHSIICI